MENVTSAQLNSEVENASKILILFLTGGNPLDQVALTRAVYDVYNDEWTNHRKSVVSRYGGRQPSAKSALKAWNQYVVQKAKDLLAWERSSKVAAKKWDARVKDFQKYLDIISQDFSKFYPAYKALVDPTPIAPYSKAIQTGKFMDVLRRQFITWYSTQRVTPELAMQDTQKSIVQFLTQHREMVTLFKTVHEPDNKSTNDNMAKQLVEMQLAHTPSLGFSFGLYSAWNVQKILLFSLFPNISAAERATFAIAMFLPVTGRMVKGGRIMYDPARLVAIYGGDLAAWTGAISYSCLFSKDRNALRNFDTAHEVMRSGARLRAQVEQNVLDTLPALTSITVPLQILHPPVLLEVTVWDLWVATKAKFPWLAAAPAFLDQFALRRVLLMGPNINHLQCQLLAELMESYIAMLMRNKVDSYSLGIKVVADQMLEFIPGHAVRVANNGTTVANRQISDGLLGYWDNGVFIIAALLEIKILGLGGREISARGDVHTSPNRIEQAEVRAYANREWVESKEANDRAGQKYDKKINDLYEDIIRTEKGDQVIRDISRLDSLALLQVNGIETKFRFLHDVTKPTTKIISMIPKNASFEGIQKIVEDENKKRKVPFQFEPFSLPFENKQLQEVAEYILDTANRMVWCPGTILDPDVCKPTGTGAEFIKYITDLYALAVSYGGPINPNVLVMQWLRHIEYNDSTWDAVAGPIDDIWISIVEFNKIQMFDNIYDPKHAIHIHVSHFGATMNGIYQQGIATGNNVNRGDISGWGGDLISFYAEWNRDNKKSSITGSDYCHQKLAMPGVNTTFKVRDLIEDADGFNVAKSLLANPKRTIVDEVTDLFKNGGGYKDRVKRFYQDRFGSNRSRAQETAKMMLIDGSDGTLTTLRYLVLKHVDVGTDRPSTISVGDLEDFCKGFVDVLEGYANSG